MLAFSFCKERKSALKCKRREELGDLSLKEVSQLVVREETGSECVI